MNGYIHVVAKSDNSVSIEAHIHQVNVIGKMMLLNNFCEALDIDDFQLMLFMKARNDGVLKSSSMRVDTGSIEEAMNREN